MSVLTRYTAREIVAQSGGVFVVVLGVFLLGRFGKLLGDASEGALPLGTILALLGLRTLMALPSLMPAVLYLGVLLGLARLYESREITACEACGVAPSRIFRVAIAISVLVAVGIALLSFSVRPWAAEKYNAVRAGALARAGLDDMSPGRFYELDEESRQVLFAGGRGADRVLSDVFFHQVTDGTVRLITSRRADEQSAAASSERFIRLYDGYQYEFPRKGRYEVTDFREMAVYLPPKEDEADLGSAKERSGWELLTSQATADRAEFQWRLAMSVSAVLLVLLALPLSRVEDRRDRYARIFVSLLLYVVYRLMLGVAKNWVADGAVPPFPGLWVIHGGCLLLGVAMMHFAGREPTNLAAFAARALARTRR